MASTLALTVHALGHPSLVLHFVLLSARASASPLVLVLEFLLPALCILV